MLPNPKLLLAVAAITPFTLLAGMDTAHAISAPPLPFQFDGNFGNCDHLLVEGLRIGVVINTAGEFGGASNDVTSVSTYATDAQNPLEEYYRPGTEVESIRIDYYNEEMTPELLAEGTQERYMIFNQTKAAPIGNMTFAGKEDVGLIRVRVTWSKAADATGKEMLTCYTPLPLEGEIG